MCVKRDISELRRVCEKGYFRELRELVYVTGKSGNVGGDCLLWEERDSSTRRALLAPSRFGKVREQIRSLCACETPWLLKFITAARRFDPVWPSGKALGW